MNTADQLKVNPKAIIGMPNNKLTTVGVIKLILTSFYSCTNNNQCLQYCLSDSFFKTMVHE